MQSKFKPTFVVVTTSSSGKVYDARGGDRCTVDGKLTWKDPFKRICIDREGSARLFDILCNNGGAAKGDSVGNPIDLDAEESTGDSNVPEHSGGKLKMLFSCIRDNGEIPAATVQVEDADLFGLIRS